MEFFQPTIIHALMSALGTLLKMDERTHNCSMYHYSRILIEIDMTKGCENFIMFESEGQIMFASLKYEKLPHFCNHCAIIGHSIDNRRSVKGTKGKEERRKNTVKTLKQQKSKVSEGEWIQKGRNVFTNFVPEIATKNGFEALADLDERGEDHPQQLSGHINSPAEAMDETMHNILHKVKALDENMHNASHKVEDVGTKTMLDEPVVAHLEGSETRSYMLPYAFNTSVSRKGNARGKTVITREYNLRKKTAPVSPPVNENTYTIISNVNIEAMA